MLRPLLFIAILVYAHMPAGSAQSLAFSPAAEDPALLQSLLTKYEQHYKTGIARLPVAYKKDYVAIYQQRWDHIKTVFDKKEVYTSEAAQQYLDALVAAIVQANPALQDSAFHCYFSRSGVPNASYLGEGLILFNMGLFCKLENESQAAFVICHEIAHYLLQHGEHRIEKYVSTLNSEAVQKELRRIKRSEYGKRALLEKLVKGITFGSSRHSRDHESQADSMAVELMRNSPFDITGALAALAILDRIDTDTLNTAACLEQMFHAKEYPFRKKWIAREEGLLGGHAHLERDSVLEDSLKTHPDCQLRIQQLEPVVANYKTTGKVASPVNGGKFAELRNTFAYEIVEYAYASDNYTRSLYYTIALLQEHPEDPYLVTQVGRILNGCYAAQQAHTLGKRIELPSPGFSPGYNLLLQFIQNLYLEDFAAISYYYLHRHAGQLSAYPAFTKAYNTSFHEIKQ